MTLTKAIIQIHDNDYTRTRLKIIPDAPLEVELEQYISGLQYLCKNRNPNIVKSGYSGIFQRSLHLGVDAFTIIMELPE